MLREAMEVSFTAVPLKRETPLLAKHYGLCGPPASGKLDLGCGPGARREPGWNPLPATFHSGWSGPQGGPCVAARRPSSSEPSARPEAATRRSHSPLETQSPAASAARERAAASLPARPPSLPSPSIFRRPRTPAAGAPTAVPDARPAARGHRLQTTVPQRRRSLRRP